MDAMNFSDILKSVINWLDDYGILAGIIGAAATALGALAKKLWDKTAGEHFKGKVKKEVAELVVKYVEQVFKNLHGAEKLEKALEAGSKMLEEKGIHITELELRVYIEAALANFNEAFKKTNTPPVSWEGDETDEVETIDPEEEVKAIEALTDEEINGEEAAG